MKIKKLISLFLAFTLSVTSTVNCFAVGSDSDSEHDSCGSFSDIPVTPLTIHTKCDSDYDLDGSFSDIPVVPLNVSPEELKRQRARIEEGLERDKQLKEQLRQSNARIIEIKAIAESNRAAFNRTKEELRQTRAELADVKRDFDVVNNALERFRGDIVCVNCCRCGGIAGEVASLLVDDMNPIPASSVFRSRRFYKGVLTGAIIVAVVLVGMYVFVYFIQAPARSE